MKRPSSPSSPAHTVPAFAKAACMLLVVLAGCLGDDATREALDGDVDARPWIEMGEQRVFDGEALFFDGRELGVGDFETFTFSFHVPEGFWHTHEGALEVSSAWDYRSGPRLAMRILDANGEIVVQSGQGNRYARTLMLTPEALNATGPSLEIEVRGVQGRTSYAGVVQFEVRPRGLVEDLLPNMVTLAPTELQVEIPQTGPFVPVYAGHEGCRPYELVEQGARRCLRFNNVVGNAGQGPFHVWLSNSQTAQAMAGLGSWTQRIWRTDGTFYDVAAGPAQFHATHGHIHYGGMAEFTLYRVDPETGARGAPVGEGRKTGFALGDYSLVALGLPGTRPGGDCRWLSDEASNWLLASNCLSANWADVYDWTLDDQFVDISGAVDGLYELVSVTNAGRTIREVNPNDNGASVVFELVGDSVRVVRVHDPWTR